MMHYEKSLESLWRWLGGAAVALLAAPFVLLIGLTKLTDRIGAMPWWQRYWGRVQWHDDEARKSIGAKRWKHYAMMWLLGAPVWVPLIWLALWGLGKADR
jgi:hypothetical protein